MPIFVTNTKQFKIINNDAKKHLGTVKTVKCVVCEFQQHSLANDRKSMKHAKNKVRGSGERRDICPTEDDPFSYSS